jgi:two-component system, OmpR family, sensor kinase
MLRFPNSLYGRFFVSLWAVTVLTIGGALALTWLVMSDRPESKPRDATAMFLEAAQTLDSAGEPGLIAWLTRLERDRSPTRVLVIGPDGRELLGRTLPPSVEYALKYPDGGISAVSPLPVLPSRPLPTLVGHDGRHYGISVRPARPRYQPNFMFLPLEDRWLVFLLAVLVTTAASFLLTRSIARPVRALGLATRQLAGGALDTRVTGKIQSRSSELVGLAQDFDAMATRIQALVQTRDQLLRDVSHELRSPLARMRVALGLARQNIADAPDALERLDREVERLDRLIAQVLNLARLEAGSVAGPLESVNVVDIIDDIVRDAAFEGCAREVAVTWHAPVDHCTIPGRAVWLASAVENVVRNALRYTRAGTAVDVALEVLPESVQISVADRGPGVPEAERARIFEPFYRVSAARERDSGGDGIGLAIVARVVQLHGGQATAVARDGGGLVIQLSLPRATRDGNLSGEA